MIHEIFPVGPLQCNCSIIGDETTREAMVIDPGDDIEDILTLIGKHNLQVKQIVITHAHIDHVGGAMKLRAATGAPILLNQNDYALLKMLDVQATWIGVAAPGAVEIDQSVSTGDTVKAGSHAANILHTPGHTGVASVFTSLPKKFCSLVIRCLPGPSAVPTCRADRCRKSCSRCMALYSLCPMILWLFPGMGRRLPLEKNGRAIRFW